MFVIEDILISTEVLTQQFVCDLEKCKGACCWEGDYGAPVEDQEIEEISQVLDKVRPMLSDEALHIIDNEGVAPYNPSYKGNVTPLMPSGACVYLAYDQAGIAKCSFEVLHEQGLNSWRKPISCHLYPVRIHKNKESEWEALNYDQWDICSAACSNGQKLKVPLFRFASDALIRKYGQDFYDQLEDLYEEFIQNQGD